MLTVCCRWQVSMPRFLCSPDCCHSPTPPLHLHFYPGSPPPPPPLLLVALLFPPSFARANCAAQWQLADLFSSDGGKRISSFVSASLCVQSHYCTMDWEWMLGFVNNNLLVLHIKSISFWKILRCTYLVYEPYFWLSMHRQCVNWKYIFRKSAKFIDWKTAWYDVSLSRQLLLQQKRKTSITTIWMSLTRKLLILSVSLQKIK